MLQQAQCNNGAPEFKNEKLKTKQKNNKQTKKITSTNEQWTPR